MQTLGASSLRMSSLQASRSTARPLSRRAVVVRAQKTVVKDNESPAAEPGNISPDKAEQRADMGIPDGQQSPNFIQAQSFDGPAPETINGRLAMLGVLAALGSEFRYGVTVKEQLQIAPVSILATFAIISLASYIPIFRGYTRKEPFANAVFSPKAENWNGRLAMMGFLGIVVVEALTKQSTVAFYGLPHGAGDFSAFSFF